MAVPGEGRGRWAELLLGGTELPRAAAAPETQHNPCFGSDMRKHLTLSIVDLPVSHDENNMEKLEILGL